MRSFNSRLTTTGFCLLIAACSPAPESARHTVPEYEADAGLRERQMAACAKDPGTLAKTPDCVNATRAQASKDIGSMRDLPPIGLSSESKDDAKSADSPPGSVPPN